ncbi:MAG: glycosyltransferase family A protein [Patescibacteria group bacterium]|nr:MAG: glycosyltransferase family A protein [Patescibacteria group bacterium]
MISIIIPTYNHGPVIGDCLDSILRQSEKDWEVIVVNDGSTDQTEEILKHYQDKFPANRFSFFSKPNEGSNPSRNFGAVRAKGDFLLFSDDDLVMKEDMLALMKQTLNENPQSAFVYCSYKYGPKLFRLFPYSEERLRRMPYIHSTSLIRKEAFPGFDNNIKRLQDWDVWLTMLENGHRGIWIDQVLFEVKTGGHISSWVPKAFYKLFPFLPTVKKYKQAEAIIKAKHNLS